MFKRILVPVDGSMRSEVAIPIAARLARHTEGSVMLLRAFSTPLRFEFPFGPGKVDPQALEEIQRALNAYMTHLAGLPVLSGIDTRTVLTPEPAVAAILDTVISERCDSIVMTSHGRTGLSRWALGSVARQVSRWASVPLLLLRSTASADEASITPLFDARLSTPRGVLVPLDGSPLAEVALEPAIELAKAIATPDSGAVHLLLALWPADTEADNMPEALALTGAHAYLQRLVEQLQQRAPEVTLTWSVISALDPASAILQIAEGKPFAQRSEQPLSSTANQAYAGHAGSLSELSGKSPDTHGYRVIAMGSHGRTGPNLWLMGSIAERVIDATRLPVLLVHAPVKP